MIWIIVAFIAGLLCGAVAGAFTINLHSGEDA